MTMQDDFSNAPTPQLTLVPEPVADAPVEVDEVELVVPEAPTGGELDAAAAEDALSAEERKMVDEFSKQIDLNDSNLIVQYGVGAQKKLTDFSESALASVRTQDLGEIGDLVSGVVAELKNFDATEEKGLFGFFKRGANKIQMMRTRYDKAEANVDKIVKSLQERQMQLMKDNATLEKMHEHNLAYFKELTMYILAGKKRLAEIRSGELAELKAKAAQTGRPEDAQAARDLDERCTRFEKKLYDLELTRTISLQMAPQIRLVQNNDITMIEKIQTTIVNTIPLWKSQMVLALGIANATEAVKAQNAVSELTNDMLKKNAEMLETSTVQVARESERGIVDIETLQKTNESLIRTFDEVVKIQQEGRQKRAEAEVEMQRIETDLRNKLLEVQNS